MEPKEKNQLFRKSFERQLNTLADMELVLPPGFTFDDALQTGQMLIADILVQAGVTEEECKDLSEKIAHNICSFRKLFAEALEQQKGKEEEQ